MSQQIPARLPGGGVDLSHLVARATPPAASGASGAPGAPGTAGGQVIDVPSLVFDVTDQTFPQAVELSTVVPVVVEIWSAMDPRAGALGPVLAKLAVEFGGRIVVARVDADRNPGLVQAFQLQAIPAAVALVAGRPVPLFQGAAPEDQVREVLGQLVQLAEQQGASGRANAPELDGAAPDAPAEPPVNPAHADALAALERGDYAAAVAAYEQVLLKAPADEEARAALVQVRLLHRLQGASAEEIRSAAAADATDIDAQMRVADLDVSGGHIEDAFLRLLDLFAASADTDARTRVRERLLELFEVVGNADPRVAAARARLANLLY